MISYSDPSKNVADPPSIEELLEVLEPMRIERERKQAIRDGLAPVSTPHSHLSSTLLMTSPEAVETASTVANRVISLPNVLKRRSPGQVEVGERATSVVRMVINQGTVPPNLPVEVGTVIIAVSLDTCLRTVRRRRNQEEVVEGGLVMDVEKRVISRETVLPRLVVGVVVVALIVVKMVIS
jgi:hypothetical protein